MHPPHLIPKPLVISSSPYLNAIEGVCRYSIRYQDADGAIIDPFLRRLFPRQRMQAALPAQLDHCDALGRERMAEIPRSHIYT